MVKAMIQSGRGDNGILVCASKCIGLKEFHTAAMLS